MEKKNLEKIYKYNSKDVILYALGIGAQISELQFIYEGVSGGLKVFPSFATRANLYGLCNEDVSHFKEFKVRFSNVIYPGESLTTEVWKENIRYLIQVKTER